MMKIFWSVLLFLLLLWGVAEAVVFRNAGVTNTTVTVTASNQGITICASIIDSCTWSVPTTAAVPLWFFKTDGACTAVTSATGLRQDAGAQYVCSPYDTTGFCVNWAGKVCAIRDSGAGDIIVKVERR